MTVHYMQGKDDADNTFISEVFAGCVRYQPLIKVGTYATRHDAWMLHRCMSAAQVHPFPCSVALALDHMLHAELGRS